MWRFAEPFALGEMERFWESSGWEVIYRDYRPGRSAQFFRMDDMVLSPLTARYLGDKFPNGLYRHQRLGLQSILFGRHTCLATGTASGKSAVFYCAALESFARAPGSKILALYPMKALGKEQEERWRNALHSAGISPDRVCRIDGDVPVDTRAGLLRKARVVIATPDVCHAWLLPSIGEREVWRFIKGLSLIVVDEVHVYSGVFGSNAAFLFRRLQHAMSIAGRSAVYLGASATIKDPRNHLRLLFGLDFNVVGPEFDTSPQYAIDVVMVRPPENNDFLTEVSRFLEFIASSTPHRFIAFVDSRKQTELISSIIARGNSGKRGDDIAADTADETIGNTISDVNRAADVDSADDEPVKEPPDHRFDHLKTFDVLPYRAGYEEMDRETIQLRLTQGSLKGVISTSALELGMDIPGLDVAVLFGVPRSMTSFTQRIGRVGRQHTGTVVVVDGGDAYSEAVFREPKTLFERPLVESTLYLENQRIQYIHAMCLARQGGEHDAACLAADNDPDSCLEQESVSWPQGFIDLCRKERTGQIPRDLQSMKSDAAENPHYAFPLRDVESQFEVHMRSRRDIARLGNLSFGQVMREAYPGAVYYYTTRPYRVTAVNPRSRTVIVRPERRYTTRPMARPPQVFPNFSEEVFDARRYGDALMLDCHLQIREAVMGIYERRGPKEDMYQYPLDTVGVRFGFNQFVRNFFSTGVLLFHPSLSWPDVDRAALSNAIYECFLIQVPFERQDIRATWGITRATWGPIIEGAPFIAFYDQVYGSLRLSSRFLDREVAAGVFRSVIKLGASPGLLALDAPTLQCADNIMRSIINGPEASMPVSGGVQAAVAVDDSPRFVRVIYPGGTGIDQFKNNEDFTVEDVFFSPTGLRYKGRHPSDTDPRVIVTLPVGNIRPIPGEPMGIYDLETGELVPEE